MWDCNSPIFKKREFNIIGHFKAEVLKIYVSWDFWEAPRETLAGVLEVKLFS